MCRKHLWCMDASLFWLAISLSLSSRLMPSRVLPIEVQAQSLKARWYLDATSVDASHLEGASIVVPTGYCGGCMSAFSSMGSLASEETCELWTPCSLLWGERNPCCPPVQAPKGLAAD
eukprot:TRINITY_DN67406_c0_g1_i1.p1 TRINITY_DN67406_c0_g1~~TRINITY_DN67406_c0_g1_i1.p1  ORF type:complete len:118 (-),score=2.38 TRINITY_DN67406_c0_g1_i1:73-426(-)